MEKGGGSSSRQERNLKEKQRRLHMKQLYNTLASLVSPFSSRLAVPEVVDQAFYYTHQLKDRVRALNQRKALLLSETGRINGPNIASSSRSLPPVLKVSTSESTLELNLITSLNNKNFMLHEVISILEEEATEVLSVSLHNSGDKTIYIIESKAFSPRIGVDSLKIQKRINELVLRRSHLESFV